MIRMTLDCVIPTQSSVIQCHTLQCWSEVFFSQFFPLKAATAFSTS